jgi:hypothetical protein
LSKKPEGFNLVGIGELFTRPEVPPDYLVEGLLIRGTVSCVVAKPKVGKSTLARGACLAVARGESLLGRATQQGSCVYLALEERREEITADFRAMGADGTEPIKIHADSAPASAIDALKDLLRTERPSMVVIDPLFRFSYIRDEKAYAEVYTKLGPLIDIARETGTHILLTHHAGKSPKADAIDSPLGSTAIGGAVATLIVLTRRDAHRTIKTVTRIGPEMPETILSFNAETRLLSVGDLLTEADCDETGQDIVDYLDGKGGNTEPEIFAHIQATNAVKRKALRSLVEQGILRREGTGRRGDAFKYSYSRTGDIARTSIRETNLWSQALADIDESAVREIGLELSLVT